MGVTALAAAGWGTKGAVNWQTDRRASALLDMALSDDPRVQQQLVDAARGNERVRVVLTKMEDDLAKYFASHPSIALGQQDRQGRKAGGRVMRDAISLAQNAVRTRKAIGGQTEQMLSMPDDAIVSALHTAKKTLGGSI
jgi:alkylation response protein AidB-like acyl-CoA dehydrogenase